MRLINCRTLRLEEFFGASIPKYTILSHTWGPEEVTFQDITLNRMLAKKKRGWHKIVRTCQLTLERYPEEQCQYAWVDTCCIDKSSSSELSEAINSMFRWYAESLACLVYLCDLSPHTAFTSQPEYEQALIASRWFKRGWCLQELIAPSSRLFFDRTWSLYGDDDDFAGLISSVHRIPHSLLLATAENNAQQLSYLCVAQKMSWAADRITTRPEDSAYCLLGIFGINMSLLYGEGSRNSFVRLQENIINRWNDTSILAWRRACSDPGPRCSPAAPEANITSDFLASSPRDFKDSGTCRPLAWTPRIAERLAELSVSNRGLRMDTSVIPFEPGSDTLEADEGRPLYMVKVANQVVGGRTADLAVVLAPVDEERGIFVRFGEQLVVQLSHLDEDYASKSNPRPINVLSPQRQFLSQQYSDKFLTDASRLLYAHLHAGCTSGPPARPNYGSPWGIHKDFLLDAIRTVPKREPRPRKRGWWVRYRFAKL